MEQSAVTNGNFQCSQNRFPSFEHMAVSGSVIDGILQCLSNILQYVTTGYTIFELMLNAASQSFIAYRDGS